MAPWTKLIEILSLLDFQLLPFLLCNLFLQHASHFFMLPPASVCILLAQIIDSTG